MNRETGDCPCGSGRALQACCAPLLRGERQAECAEQLMRSRYTAFTRGDEAYLQRTWHSSTRPECLHLDTPPAPVWQGLRILATRAGETGDDRGSVEFEASYRVDGRPGVLHETSRFVREGGQWRYLDGEIAADPQPPAPARNQPCPCGSGRKFKRCCGV
jgi:SEC-C motif-containing protein